MRVIHTSDVVVSGRWQFLNRFLDFVAITLNEHGTKVIPVKGSKACDTWVGEAALVQWGSGPYADQGWLRYNRHGRRANYIYADAHAENLPWSKARYDQFPDHRVRKSPSNPPQ